MDMAHLASILPKQTISIVFITESVICLQHRSDDEAEQKTNPEEYVHLLVYAYWIWHNYSINTIDSLIDV